MIRFCSFTGESNESLSRIRLKDMGTGFVGRLSMKVYRA
ncbi:hypothetical protein L433_10242 [Klebsiella pneumoniae BIDMC 7A]|nr:hypothetical protein L433_10242 [Klebsiella pneumoniae BIDMC 7A]SYN69286.1 Uncharacterised protein [Klebsiella pneumoniae]SYO32590.1 Uncharacterised protein [Klebsiella pneumoniae]SYS11204.1 Uncharacterised protein [Klebsiella pneumoniae]